ncbi:uncharacterized protein LOC100487738 [Xenopus tropicalis]|uniref:Uncharacterized LOC100487738 n=1 Tax=Xenopus tropicalis TaxID=8364 RepID=A0A6I8QWF3_XENTR|nr:uncharacterized protein LOC100487738 [Xenopus tropicalis]|eukprot:XP_002939397.1 PREDICTED: uncharacterized protein LOC100487738 [Xenopus tropicalis]
MPKCIVNGCPHRSGQKLLYPDVVLHPFPKNIERIRNWLLQTGQHSEDLELLTQRIFQGWKTANFRMCSKHFTEGSYMQSGSRRILKPNAVPTIFDTVRVPITTLFTVAPSLPIVASAKRRRVDDEQPSTASTIVRVISRLVTVGTQTDAKVNMVNTSTMTCTRCRNCSTQTKKILTKETSSQSGEEFIQADVHHILQDHLYPVCFSTRSKPTSKISDLQSTMHSTSAPMESFISPIGGEPSTSILEPFVQSSFGSIADGDSTFDIQELSSGGYSTDSDSFETEEERTVVPEVIKSKKKFIIYEDKLDDLLHVVRCQHNIDPPCQSPIVEVEKKLDGSMLSVRLTCLDGHSMLWNSQPTFGETSIGNLEITGSIILTGATYQKTYDIFKLLSIPFISHTMFYNYQRNYVFPAIDHQWKKEKDVMARKRTPMALAGDGQFDSPGHSAKFCTYTMMDVTSKKIIDFKIEQLGSGKTAGQTECEAFDKCLHNLVEKVKVKVVATDRRGSIRKLMATKYKKIDHQFDVWRLCKSLHRKLLAASKKRKCKDISRWISAITNHLWWSAQTCDQNVDLLLDKWKSVLYHVANEHSFGALKHYQKCQHRRLTPEEQKQTCWIGANHPAHSVLAEIINDTKFLNDLSHIGKFCHTGDLENFHSKVSRYKPKRLSFPMDSVIARTTLAALSHNRNVKRKQGSVQCPAKSTLSFGQNRDQIVFPKLKKDWAAKPVFEGGVDDHLFEILQDCLKILTGELQHDWSSTAREMPNNYSYC